MRPLYVGCLAATALFVLATTTTALALGPDWTLAHRFAIVGASLGWGGSVAVRRHRRRD